MFCRVLLCFTVLCTSLGVMHSLELEPSGGTPVARVRRRGQQACAQGQEEGAVREAGRPGGKHADEDASGICGTWRSLARSRSHRSRLRKAPSTPFEHCLGKANVLGALRRQEILVLQIRDLTSVSTLGHTLCPQGGAGGEGTVHAPACSGTVRELPSQCDAQKSETLAG